MKAVIVDDQTLFREFLVDLLENKLGLTVCGTAAEGPEAVELVRETQPDLVILDILIPKLSGILVARILMDELPGIRILGISSETDVKTIHQVHQLRLSGFVDKNEATVEILSDAIRAIQERRRYFSESLKLTIQKLRADPMAFQKILTPREQEILTFIGGGLSDSEIGKHLGLSDASVQTHRRNLFRKLDVHSTPELIRFAQESGFWKASFKKMELGETYHIHD